MTRQLIDPGDSAWIGTWVHDSARESLRVVVSWDTPVDLDLYLWRVFSDTLDTRWGTPLDVPLSDRERVAYANRVDCVNYSRRVLPCDHIAECSGGIRDNILAELDQDAGIGGRVALGGNAETIRIHRLGCSETMLIGLHNFSGNAPPQRYNPRVQIQGAEIDVSFPFDGSPLRGFAPPAETDCLAALFVITRYGGIPRIMRLNRGFPSRDWFSGSSGARRIRELAQPFEVCNDRR